MSLTQNQIKTALSAMLKEIHNTDTFKLAVCVPSQENVKTDFAVSLFSMAMHLGMEKIKLPWVQKHAVMLFNRKSSIIHSMRHMLVVDAIEWGATHILFVDSDQTFPADVVHRLALHDKMMVGANIVTKQFPAQFCATGLNGKRVITRPSSTGLEEVNVCGTGLVLINTKVFDGLSLPYFLMPYNEATRTFMGEDVYFSNIVRARGHQVFIDHDVSKTVGHVGQMEFNFTHAGEVDKDGYASIYAADSV